MAPAVKTAILLRPCDDGSALAASLTALAGLEHGDFAVLTVKSPVWEMARFRDLLPVINWLEPPDGEDLVWFFQHRIECDLVAFLAAGDCPQPHWLTEAMAAFHDDATLALTGPAQSNGQKGFHVANRLGDFKTVPIDPSRFLNFPFAAQVAFPDPAGAVFSRRHLLAIGGLDPGFGPMRATADAAFRLLDRGYTIKCLDVPGGAGRTSGTTYDPLADQLRFLWKHGRRAYPALDVLRNLLERAERSLPDIGASLVEDALARALDQASFRRIHADATVRPRRWFPPQRPSGGGKLHLVFFCQWHNPTPINGVERVIHQLARGLAARGHTIRVMTRGDDQPRLNYEHGVWIHEVPITVAPMPDGLGIHPPFWNYAASLDRALMDIHQHHSVDAMQCPNWDSEGIATILNGMIPAVLAVYTPFKSWLIFHRDKLGHGAPVERSITEIGASERLCYQQAPRLLACGPSIIAEIEQQYGLAIAPERLAFLPHGLEDKAAVTRRARAADDEIHILFVGRLERRKGIDTVLGCIEPLCMKHANVHFIMVGDDRFFEESDQSHREIFEQSEIYKKFKERIVFTGTVNEDRLWQYYADSDIFIAPSRFESFGLILIEAMMFGRAAIGCRVGGMAEIITDAVDGFLIPPGDTNALIERLDRLIASAGLRHEMGRRARATYEARYGLERMIDQAELFYRAIAGHRLAANDPPDPPADDAPR